MTTPPPPQRRITMNAILAAVMITTISVLVHTGAMAQTQPAPTVGNMKSAVEQQANQ